MTLTFTLQTYSLYDDIEAGTEFYFTEEDYCSPEQLDGTEVLSKNGKVRKIKVKQEPIIKAEAGSTPSISSSSNSETLSTPSINSTPSASNQRLVAVASPKAKKRPRRSATSSVKSYAVPDSDDEDIVDGLEGVFLHVAHHHAKKRRSESNLQRWIKHLTLLLKEEQRKVPYSRSRYICRSESWCYQYKEHKKRVQAAAIPGTKLRIAKVSPCVALQAAFCRLTISTLYRLLFAVLQSDFYKSLASNLPRLRKADQTKRKALYGADVPDEDYSEGEEDEYHQHRTTRSKRRKLDVDD